MVSVCVTICLKPTNLHITKPILFLFTVKPLVGPGKIHNTLEKGHFTLPFERAPGKKHVNVPFFFVFKLKFEFEARLFFSPTSYSNTDRIILIIPMN